MEKLYINHNMLFKDKLPQDLHITFRIIKLLIEKGNLDLIHNKNSYQHFNYLSRKRKLNKLYMMRCNSWTIKSDFTYVHYIYQISSIPALFTSQHPIYKKQEKLIHDFILYIRNFLHKMGSRY